MITVSQLRVSMLVARQLISTTRPLVLSISTQSPMRSESSSWMATPASRLPSVSCMANASTAVMTAEVATICPSSTPALCSRSRPQAR